MSAVAKLLADGVTADTVAVLENASVEPLAFTAVTRQRIGLKYPELKKLEGGVYVDRLLVPGALTYVGVSKDCHRYWYTPSASTGSHVPLLVTLYVVTPTVPEVGEIVGATVLIGAGRLTDTELLVDVAEVENVEFTAVTTKRK